MKYLVSNPNIMGGDLVLIGSRLPIDEVLNLLQQGKTIVEIHELYPWIKENILKGAINEALTEAVSLLTAKYHHA